MTDRIAVTILTVLIVIYFAMISSIAWNSNIVAIVAKTGERLELSNKQTCCMKIPYVYRGRTNEVCYNPTDTTYNFVEIEIIRQWKDLH